MPRSANNSDDEKVSLTESPEPLAGTAGAHQPSNLETSKIDLLQEISALRAEVALLRTYNTPAGPAADEIDEVPAIELTPFFAELERDFSKRPPIGASARPHLFDLHGEETFDTLRAQRRGPSHAVEEYTSIYCATFYLRAAAESFRANILDNLTADGETADYFRGYDAVVGDAVGLLENRLGLIQARTLGIGEDPVIAEYLRSQTYEQAAIAKLTGRRTRQLLSEYTEQRDRQVLKQAAQSAARKTLGARDTSRDRPPSAAGTSGGGGRSTRGGDAMGSAARRPGTGPAQK